MEYTFLSATVLLILITDPLGNIPLFISCLRGVAPKRRAIVILREVAIAFAILLVFMVVGDRGLKEGKLEYQARRATEATLLPVEDAANVVIEKVRAALAS